MIDVNKGHIKSKRLNGILLLIFGIILFSVFGYLYFKNISRKNAYDMSVTADKIDSNCSIDTNDKEVCSPIYYFKIDEVEHVCYSKTTSGSANSELKKVYYEKNDPSACITEFDLEISIFIPIMAIVSFCIILISIIIITNSIFLSLRVKRLIKKGTLFKGVAFTAQNTNLIFSGKPIVNPIVDLTTPDGKTLHLIGDSLPLNKFASTSSTVDVLIDLDNPRSYYIDYEIRVSGEIPNTIIDLREKKVDIFGSNSDKKEFKPIGYELNIPKKEEKENVVPVSEESNALLNQILKQKDDNNQNIDSSK